MRRAGRRDPSSTVAGALGQERLDAAARIRAVEQAQASRTVAGHALDVGDCRELLSMLGLAVPAHAARVPAQPFGPNAEEHVR